MTLVGELPLWWAEMSTVSSLCSVLAANDIVERIAEKRSEYSLAERVAPEKRTKTKELQSVRNDLIFFKEIVLNFNILPPV